MRTKPCKDTNLHRLIGWRGRPHGHHSYLRKKTTTSTDACTDSIQNVIPCIVSSSADLACFGTFGGSQSSIAQLAGLLSNASSSCNYTSSTFTAVHFPCPTRLPSPESSSCLAPNYISSAASHTSQFTLRVGLHRPDIKDRPRELPRLRPSLAVNTHEVSRCNEGGCSVCHV